jgi:hypothetical protein
LIRVPKVPPRQENGGSEKEEEQSRDIGQSPPFVPFPALNTKNPDAPNKILTTLMRPPKGYDLYDIPSRGQGLRVPANAVIILIK